ncbi:hypothetical protein [Actinomadura sp. NTSP31]|uniref:hypothetical protein n=1 Tax=Actinomadura sp. NTSP31 TaxID=1735447 RepID=UPI0035C0EB67
MLLLDDDVVLGGTFGCYRLTELAAGRTTVFRVRVSDGHCGEAVRCADSLLDLLYDFHADIHRKLEREFGQPSDRGAGSVDRQEVDQAWSIAETSSGSAPSLPRPLYVVRRWGRGRIRTGESNRCVINAIPRPR